MKNTLIVLSLILSFSLGSFAMAGVEEYKFLEGRWGWGDCESNRHEILFTQNGEFLEFKADNGSYYYFIAGAEEKGLKVVLLGEQNFDSKNNPIFWYVVKKDVDTYFWLRSDREKNDLRGPIRRCK